MKLTGNGSYALLNQAVTPKGKLIIFILLERESFPLLPFSPKQTFAHQIQLSLAQSEHLCT